MKNFKISQIKKIIKPHGYSIGTSREVTLNGSVTEVGSGQTVLEYEVLDSHTKGLSTEICLVDGKILDTYSCEDFDTIEEFLKDLKLATEVYLKLYQNS